MSFTLIRSAPSNTQYILYGFIVRTQRPYSKTNFFLLVFFYRGGFSRAIIYTSSHLAAKRLVMGHALFCLPFFSPPLLLRLQLLLFIFYTAFIKNLLTIDSALVSTPSAIWPQSGGRRGGNCFVRRPNKNYKTFMQPAKELYTTTTTIYK